MYEHRRNKPGLKVGALEGLNRRIGKLACYSLAERSHRELMNATEAVERLLSQGKCDDRGSTRASLTPSSNETSHPHPWPGDVSPMLAVMTSLTSEIGKLNDNLATANKQSCSSPFPTEFPEQLFNNEEDSSRKRRRVHPHKYAQPRDRDIDLAYSPPRGVLLQGIVDTYFERINPWLPLIHEPRFRREFALPDGKESKAILLHAMTFAVLSESTSRSLSFCVSSSIHEIRSASEDFVMRNAMSQLSVEGLQALSLLAFIYVSPL
jgi:hypothetical protein